MDVPLTSCYLGGVGGKESKGGGGGRESCRWYLCGMVDRKRVSVFRVDLGIQKSGHPCLKRTRSNKINTKTNNMLLAI